MTPMKRVAVRWLCMGVMAWVAGAGVAQATLVLEGTRIVYPEKAKDVSIRAESGQLSHTRSVLALTTAARICRPK